MPNAYPTADEGSYPGYRRLRSGMLKQAEIAQKLADLAVGLDDIADQHWQLVHHINDSSLFRLLQIRRQIRRELRQAEAEAE